MRTPAQCEPLHSPLSHRPRTAASARISRILLLAALPTLACESATGALPCTANSAGAVTITAGTHPSISWAADCQASVLIVFSAPTATEVWTLVARQKEIPKPVQYGVNPPGARVAHAAEALTPGTEYGVLVSVVNGSDTLTSVDYFTP